MMKERDKLLQLATRKNDSLYWIRGCKLRKDVIGFIKKAKRDYILGKLKTHKNDSKKYWKSIQLVLPNARFLRHLGDF